MLSAVIITPTNYIIKVFTCKEMVICQTVRGVIFLAIGKSDIIFACTLAKRISLGGKPNITTKAIPLGGKPNITEKAIAF